MDFKRYILYNKIIYPTISLLNIKKDLFTSYSNTRNILDSCSENILHRPKYKTGEPPVQKGWIVTNNNMIFIYGKVVEIWRAPSLQCYAGKNDL